MQGFDPEARFLPLIFPLILAALAPAGPLPTVGQWGFWAEDTASASVSAGTLPIQVTVENPHAWSFSSPRSVPVNAGETWTLTAVVAGRDLGWIAGGGGSLGIMALDSAKRIIDWQLGAEWVQGSFPWRIAHVTVTVRPGTAALIPRLYGYGGGSLFVTDATLEKSDRPSNLVLPAFPAPAPPVRRAALPAPADSAQGLYPPGATVRWTLAPQGTDGGRQTRYAVVDAGGKALQNGAVAIRGSVTYRPRHPGYYELRIDDTLSGASPGLRVWVRSGVAVVARPAHWALGSNPFGYSGGDEAFLSRLGFTWTRPLHFNVVTGSHKRLPDDSSAYAEAWRQTVLAGLPKSHLNTIEVWNEPHNELDSGWTIEQFVRMVGATADGARRANPKVRIAVNLDWAQDFPRFHKAGGAPLYQIATLHPYTQDIFKDPPYCSAHGPEADRLLEYLDTAHALIPGKEIWSTEYGWPTAPGYPFSTSELDQARFIVRSTLLQLAQGVTRVLPFAAEDVPGWGPKHGSFGLRRADLSPKPALAAYAVLAQTVDDKPYAGRLDLGVANLGAFLFGAGAAGQASVLALWSPWGEKSVKLALPAGTRRIDLFGADTILAAGRGATLIAGSSPVYLMLPLAPAKVAALQGKKLLTAPPKGIFTNP
jgi:hypothetical protein